MPKGTKIFIREVKENDNFDSFEHLVYGLARPPKYDKDFEFVYVWGSEGTICRAPWEDENVPDERTVGRTWEYRKLPSEMIKENSKSTSLQQNSTRFKNFMDQIN